VRPAIAPNSSSSAAWRAGQKGSLGPGGLGTTNAPRTSATDDGGDGATAGGGAPAATVPAAVAAYGGTYVDCGASDPVNASGSKAARGVDGVRPVGRTTAGGEGMNGGAVNVAVATAACGGARTGNMVPSPGGGDGAAAASAANSRSAARRRATTAAPALVAVPVRLAAAGSSGVPSGGAAADVRAASLVRRRALSARSASSSERARSPALRA